MYINREYCTENGFGVHIKRRLINGINKIESKADIEINQISSWLHVMTTDLIEQTGRNIQF